VPARNPRARRDGRRLADDDGMSSSRFPRKILVAVDFDEPSDGALDAAFALAASAGANVCIMHAFDAAAPARDHGPRSAEAARWMLQSLATRRTPAFGASVTTRLEEGDPRARIAEAATAAGADLVVVGTHARARTPRALLGSVAEAVVRTSSVPVLTVRASLPRTM
jgi:nucleotide-binding universal stress UspA family protein